MSPALLWMEHVLGFERYWDVEFHTRDVGRVKMRDGSGLRSVVMWDRQSGLKFANNEPYRPNFKASQINLFNEDHRGDGVQHIALEVRDIIGAVRALRARGVEFMRTPPTYYDALPERLRALSIDAIDEDIATLRELELLVDGHGLKSYLLQIFLKDSAGMYGSSRRRPVLLRADSAQGRQRLRRREFPRPVREHRARAETPKGANANAGASELRRSAGKGAHGAVRRAAAPCATKSASRAPASTARTASCITSTARTRPSRSTLRRTAGQCSAGERSARSQRHHFRSFEQRQRGGAALDARVPLLENDDLVISVLAPDAEDPAYFVNADGDQLLFIREGGGLLRTQLGDLRFRANDYLCLPRGLLASLLARPGRQRKIGC